MKRRQCLETIIAVGSASAALTATGIGRPAKAELDGSDPVLAYIDANFDRSVYQDTPGSGFGGVDLPYRYTSPCIKDTGRFYFFFYWDTYFTNFGLLKSGRADIAKENILNMLWLIRRQGYMPNHVGIYNRSQPPYLCRMVRTYIAATGDRSILPEAAQGLLAEYNYWMTAHLNGTGLNQYAMHDTWAGQEEFGRFHRVTAIKPVEGKTIEEIRRSGADHLAEAETGCDFTPRFENRALDFVATDLNALLYEYELTLAQYQTELGWNYNLNFKERAEKRKELINKYLWNEEKGWFFDYDYINDRSSNTAAITGLLMMVAGIASKEQAARMVKNLNWFEREHGIAFTPDAPGCRNFQWSFPNVWPPMAWLTVEALRKYGYETEARRLAGKYVKTARSLFAKTGQLWEKTDAETGDVAGGEYDAAPMIGWTAGVYIALADYLNESTK